MTSLTMLVCRPTLCSSVRRVASRGPPNPFAITAITRPPISIWRFAQWIHGINRGILLPPGLDEQWLISIMHTESDAMRYADVFADFVDELTK